jgi:hypothetical protein
MITLIFLTSILPFLVSMIVLLCATVIYLARTGYPDASTKPAPGSRWPRLTPRKVWAILRSGN